MFESVYVCRASYNKGCEWCIDVFPAHIGIVKKAGCCYFASANNYKKNDGYGKPTERISKSQCRQQYSSVPPAGTAWLVEEGRKYINWTRVDHNMHLLNPDGSITKT